eukprot:2391887-Prymnesium_polylepis.1
MDGCAGTWSAFTGGGGSIHQYPVDRCSTTCSGRNSASLSSEATPTAVRALPPRLSAESGLRTQLSYLRSLGARKRLRLGDCSPLMRQNSLRARVLAVLDTHLLSRPGPRGQTHRAEATADRTRESRCCMWAQHYSATCAAICLLPRPPQPCPL